MTNKAINYKGLNLTKMVFKIDDDFEEVAGAERLELSTVGFGDRCSTIRTMPL